jgi:prepilin-type N-terminal cleavage/methylation domain-containing protein
MRPVNKNAKTSSACNKNVKAFTLIELLLSTVLGGILLSAVAFTFANMAGSFAEQPTTGQMMDWDANNDNIAGNDPIPFSPAYSQLPSAFNLQAEISDALQATITTGAIPAITGKAGLQPVTAIFVISTDENDADGKPEQLPSTLNDAAIAEISGVASAKLTSSTQFYSYFIKTHPLDVPDAQGYPKGYSIYFISGDNTVSMAVHCRITPLDDGYIYVVKTYDHGTFCPSLSYAFGVKNKSSSVLPSAKFIKLRANASWGIDEDIGTQVIFPDPSVVAYQVEAGDADAVRTYSRFAVLLPIKP